MLKEILLSLIATNFNPYPQYKTAATKAIEAAIIQTKAVNKIDKNLMEYTNTAIAQTGYAREIAATLYGYQTAKTKRVTFRSKKMLNATYDFTLGLNVQSIGITWSF